MSELKKFSIYFSTALALLVTAFGIYRAIHSPLFIVRVVEVADQADNAPLDGQQIINLAQVPVGQVSLVDLDLNSIEKKILAHPWIKEVHLQKRFPQTLSISVDYRDAHALIQKDEGALSYVDSDGVVFGKVSLNYQPDLPVLSGFSKPGTLKHLPDALKLIDGWEKSELKKISQISSLAWDDDRGFRALITYEMQSNLPQMPQARAMVDFGQDIDAQVDSEFARLSRVLDYLSRNQVVAKQIWADSGKKIVVKTAHGS
jgi:cell division septal protein FtsQ